MEISVIIVNYKVKYFLEQTLKSVEEALYGISNEIFVVDNNSEDDSIDFLKARFPNVNYIENDENIGFARANNQAINKATGTYTLILNPDTIISKRVINDCVDFMHTHKDCGCIGVKMLDGNGKFLPESKRSFPTPWVSFCKIFGLSALFPYSRIFAKYHLRYLDNEKIHKIDILAGAYMFARTHLLKEANGFDESFFMYGEDIDLSYRMVELGYDNYYLPSPIIHYKGESTKKNSMKFVKSFYEAMLIFFRKHYPNYGTLYSFFVKGAVVARAAIATTRRLILKVTPTSKSTPTNNWIIISDCPSEIENILSADGGKIESIIGNETALNKKRDRREDIILDNSKFAYEEIISIISKNNCPKRFFHIYSKENGIIISPKMNL